MLKTFSDLGLAETLLRAVTAEGYTHPTPIQAEVIPAALSGRDILGIAQTGTGKTASFVLPLLHRISERAARPGKKQTSALILAPTRELATQIMESIRTYGKQMRPSVALVVGGAKPGPQIKALSRGLDVVVATPGRLEDHMSSGHIRLDATEMVVLDEADQMLDLGFMPAIRRILGKLPGQRQTMLLSATMPKPIRALAHDFLNKPAEISVAPAAQPIERIDQKVIHVEAPAKRSVLTGILSGQGVGRAIVFTRTKRGADKLNQHLQKAGLSAAAIHGNKSQSQRDRALKAFKDGRVPILVATDVAARGIDVDDVSHIINFDLPNVPEAYVHRIGRTARAGKDGTAISLCDPSERGLLRDIERLIAKKITARDAEGNIVELAAPAGRGASAHPDKARSKPRKNRRRPGKTGQQAGHNKSESRNPNQGQKQGAKPRRQGGSKHPAGAKPNRQGESRQTINRDVHAEEA